MTLTTRHDIITDQPTESAIDDLISKATSEVPLLSSEQVEMLAHLDASAAKEKEIDWRAVDMLDIVGVVAGIKPSAFLNMDGPDAEKIMTKLGLAWHQTIGGGMAISRFDTLADALAARFEHLWDGIGDRDTMHREIGKLLGYPATATEYFIKRSATIDNPIDEQLPMILPEELEGTVRGSFHQFVLSPEAWRDELESHVVPIEAAVKELAPLTYEAFEREVNRERRKQKFRSFIGRKASPRFGGAPIAIRKVK